MFIRSFRPWAATNLPAHHVAAQAICSAPIPVLSRTLYLIQDVASRILEEHSNDPGLAGVRLTDLHRLLSDRILIPLQSNARAMEMFVRPAASAPTLALQIIAGASSTPHISIKTLVADLTRVGAQARMALEVRRICESSDGSIELTSHFTAKSLPAQRVRSDAFERALGSMPELYLWLSRPLRENREICRRLFRVNPHVVAFFSDELLRDASLIQALINDCAEPGNAFRLPCLLAMLPQTWKDHPDLAAECVRIWWTSLSQIGDALLSDRAWVERILPPDDEEDHDEQSASYGLDAEIRTHLIALCAETAGEDWPFMQKLLGSGAKGWSVLSDKMRDNREAALALLDSGFDLEWVDEEIAALSNRLLADRDLARAFVERGVPLRVWDESLWRDPELAALDLLNAAPEEVYLPETLANDRQLALCIVAKKPELLCEFSPEVRQDPEIFAKAVSGSVRVLEMAGDAQRASMALMRPAMRAWGHQALRLTADSLRRRSAGPNAAALFGELLSRPDNGVSLSLAADEDLRYDPALRNLARDKPEGFAPKEFAFLRRETSFNRARWEDLLERDWAAFFWAPDWVRRDRTLTVLASRRCIQENSVDLNGDDQVIYPTDLCHPEIRSDVEMWKEILSDSVNPETFDQLWKMLMAAPQAVRYDPDLLLLLLRVVPSKWKSLPREARRHPVLVDAMIPLVSELIAKEFYDDERIMQRCCEQLWPLIRFASNRLRSPGPFVRHWLVKKPRLLRYLSHETQSDPSCVMLAIASDWTQLKHASDSARANPEIVQAAMRVHPCALGYADRSLRENREFLLDCLRKGLSLSVSVADRLADDVASAVHNPEFRLVRLAENPEFWMDALRELGPSCLARTPITLRRHALLMREGIRLDRSVLEITSPLLRADASFMLDVLAQHPEAIAFLHGTLARNRSFQARASELLQRTSANSAEAAPVASDPQGL